MMAQFHLAASVSGSWYLCMLAHDLLEQTIVNIISSKCALSSKDLLSYT